MIETPPSSTTSRWIVRHGVMRFLGVFEPAAGLVVSRGNAVISRTERGLETAEVVCIAHDRAVAMLPEPTSGQIIRLQHNDDRRRIEHIRSDRARQYDVARHHIAELKLQMELIDVEQLFGGERIVFYFLSEKRVDFRELVKHLAREFQTRIELRQVGVRDEAKLLADYGDCGKPVCCNTHMTVMPPVSMKMAKVQKSTLDPAKISGRCGRLKCCLRFEQHVYEEFQAELPPINSRVLTSKGQGRVLAQEILARRVLVELEDGRRLPVPLADVLTRLGSGR